MVNASKLDFKKTSLIIGILYAICVAFLIGLYVKGFYAKAKLIRLFALWIWIITPQFILFCYVSRFSIRWAQFISLLLQIALCFSLYNYGIPVFADYDDIKYETVFVFLPIWHYVTVATTGLVMKIIQSY